MLVKQLLLLLASSVTAALVSGSVNETNCNGNSYIYHELAGYGFVATDARDRFGDTIGGIGSAISIPGSTWRKLRNGSYTGTMWATPDRGWNTQGTLNYQNRIHKFQITLDPNSKATVAKPSGVNIFLKYITTTLFVDPEGVPTTGLDADGTGAKKIRRFPDLPRATYTGDGFGGPGYGGRRVSIDAEGLVVNRDGTFWVSDEYGPYIYRFGRDGRMLQAIAPPQALIPMRNGSESFSSDAPPVYSNGTDDDVTPAEVDSGRVNNHGLEGLTASPDGRNLYVLLQAATHQDGGESKSTERYTRMLHYAIDGSTAVYKHEYIVPLPTYPSGKKPNAAAQSEFHYISPTQFVVLARDSGAGQGQSNSLSVYRQADVFDISQATDIKGATYDCANCTVAPGGVLDSAITPATYCSWLDYNVNSQLNRFGLHNGGAQDAGLLNEKWESLSFVPVNDGSDGEFFLFSMSDNDFITQNGYYNFGRNKYRDSSGFNLSSQILAFRVSLPAGARPV